MNVHEESNTWLLWIVAGCLTFVVGLLAGKGLSRVR